MLLTGQVRWQLQRTDKGRVQRKRVSWTVLQRRDDSKQLEAFALAQAHEYQVVRPRHEQHLAARVHHVVLLFFLEIATSCALVIRVLSHVTRSDPLDDIEQLSPARLLGERRVLLGALHRSRQSHALVLCDRHIIAQSARLSQMIQSIDRSAQLYVRGNLPSTMLNTIDSGTVKLLTTQDALELEASDVVSLASLLSANTA